MADKEILKKLSQPKLWRWLTALAVDWFIVLTAMVFMYHAWFWNNLLQWPLLLALLIIVGARQHAIAILGHDGAHYLAYKSRFWNDFLTNLFCFWPLGVTIESYRGFHFKHHQTIGTSEDPERFHYKKLLPQWNLPLKKTTLIFQLITDFLGGALPHIAVVIYITRPKTFKNAMGPFVMIGSTIFICWQLGYVWIPLVWLLAQNTAFWAVFRLRIWTEHIGAHYTHLIVANWWQKFLFVPHNTWCHYDHHKYSNIPFWNLPRLRNLIIKPKEKPLTIGQLFKNLT